MKKVSLLLLSVLLLLSLSACGGPKTFNFTTADLDSRISDALKQMGDKTDLKIISKEKNKDGKHVIVLSNRIMIFAKTEGKKVSEVTLGATPEAYLNEEKDLKTAFLLLVGTVDDSLSLGDRNKLISKLGLKDDKKITDSTTTVTNNDIQYTYKGDIKDSFLLRAELK